MSRRLRITRLEDRVTPAIATWDGGGGIIGNNNWSLPLNWVGDVAPQPGDDLVFGNAPQTMAVNNFAAGTLFRSITINDFFSGYQISGNAIAISAGIVGNANSSTISLDMTLTAPQTFSLISGSGFIISGSINLNGQVLTTTVNGGGGISIFFPGVVRLTGSITGNGGIIKDGSQWLVLTGNNTFTGPIDHRSGHLSLGSNNAGGATGPANLTQVGAGAVLNIEFPNLTIPETINFVASAPDNANQLAVAASTGVVQNGVTLTGPVTLQGSSRWLGGVVVAGGLFGVGPLSLGGGYGITFPSGTVSSYDGFLFADGSSVFNGSGPSGLVTANDIFAVSGTGTIGPLTVQGQTRFRPGDNGIGTLTTGNLIEGAFYEVELGNTGNDKVVVNGTVALGGTLVVQPQAGFTPAAGSVFRIIDNDGVDPIAGGFGGLPQGALAATINGVQLFVNYRGGDGNDVELATTQTIPTEPPPFYSVGAGPGGAPQVNVYSESGALIRSFFAYDVSFRGGVHVATADVTSDGVPDVITAPGFGGGPVIRIWDGGTGALLTEYNAYDPNFRGGAFVAAGRMNSDLTADIITGAGAGGGPHVKVFNAGTTQVLAEFLAYDPIFLGGVSVGAIDFVNTGSFNDQGIVVTGAGAGGGPHVKTFGGLSGGQRASFFAYEATFTGGVYVAGGRISGLVVNPEDNNRILVSPGAGRSAEVRVFDAAGVPSFSFLAYDPAFKGGATVAFRPGFDFGVVGGITGAGPGGGPHVKTFGTIPEQSFFAFDPSFTGGVFVG